MGNWESEWKEHTTAFDRIRSTVMGVDEPRSAAWIAEHAAVAESTARDHLKRLLDMGLIRAIDANVEQRYEPDPAYIRFREIQHLVNEHDRDELVEFVADVKAELEDIEETYGISSAKELRDLAAAPEQSAQQTRELRCAASDVEHLRYRRSVLADAINRYDLDARGDLAEVSGANVLDSDAIAWTRDEIEHLGATTMDRMSDQVDSE